MKRSNLGKEEEMQRRHVLEKRRLPKILKNEAKTRAQMFKQSLRLSVVGSPEDDRAKMKQVANVGHLNFTTVTFSNYIILRYHTYNFRWD